MNSEEILREAVIQFHKMELEALPSGSYLAERQEVSPEFHRKMVRLINVSMKRGKRRKMIRNVAALILGVFASLIFLCCVNDDMRARCLRFIRNTVGGMTEYRSDVSPDTNSMTENVKGLKLGYVPDGFVLEKGDAESMSIRYRMKNFDVYLDFTYVGEGSGVISINTEDSVREKVELEDGSEADLYKAKNENDADTLMCRKYGFICAISIEGSSYLRKEEELLKIADNIIGKN